MEYRRIVDDRALDDGPVEFGSLGGRQLVLVVLDHGALDLPELDDRTMDHGTVDRGRMVAAHGYRVAP